jgi:hypothetical protein
LTLDAMHWVWNRARARGNARLVLLAVADATTDAKATARMGTAEFMQRLAAARSTTLAAVAAALESGELVLAEPAAGSRAARYLLPGAVDYSRDSGPNPGPQTMDAGGSGSRTTNRFRSGSRTTTATATGPDFGPQRPDLTDALWSESQTACGPKSGPHQPPIEGMNEGGKERPAPAVVPGGIPDFARPLVDTLTASGVIVRWDLGTGEWLTLDAMIQRSGVDLLAAAALKAAGKADISHARYLLRAWRSLPPKPADGTTPVIPQHAGPNVVPFDANQPRRSRAQRTADELALILAREAAQQ